MVIWVVALEWTTMMMNDDYVSLNSNIIMIISEPYLQTHHSSSKNKENFHRASDYDDLRSIVSRNEQALM